MELELISKDSSDAAIRVASPPTAHEDVLEVASKEGIGAESGEAGTYHEHSFNN